MAAIELKQQTQVSVEYKSTKAVTQQSKYKNLYEKKNGYILKYENARDRHGGGNSCPLLQSCFHVVSALQSIVCLYILKPKKYQEA